MNILLRNYPAGMNALTVGAIIEFYSMPKQYNELVKEKPLVNKYDSRLGCAYNVTKQGNGNLCIEITEVGEIDYENS